MSKLFISHSSEDDGFVRELRWTLADLKQEVWIDSRELRAGDPLWPEIQKAIEASSAVAVVVSPNSLQAKWVGKELRHALAVQKQRGRENFRVFALSLDGTKLGVLESLFDEEPLYIPVSSAAGGVEAAMNPILVALGKRLPAEVPVLPQPKAEPLEELVLELTDLKFHEQDGIRRASARARLVYEPATPGQREVASAQSWRLVAPIGPIEAGELSWYLEHYAIWPSHYFRDRARKVEENLVQWGKLLHDAALPAAHRENVMTAWAKISDHAGRRFSVHVDAALEAGTSASDAAVIREAATLLLGLPWELLHDGDGYLFQGAKPTRVRRRLPNTRTLDISVVATPIRVLLVTARPEDEACGYIDHRASALPLVEAMEKLGGLVRLHVLSAPTFDALGKELKRAFDARESYHVVHFDGHGVYDRRVGLGGLCFEDPQDTAKLDRRRHVTVHTDKLGPLLKDFRIPLVFLEACQTAQAEDTSESVASELLQRGVASVVAMSHSVLVETARRFVETFYAALAHGQRVGDAMLAGQRSLKDDTSRGRIFGAGELWLEDWFVPVLFQEKDDPQLFRSTPAPQTQEDLRTILSSRLGDLPAVPATGFIGRSRELLALQRLLSSGTGFPLGRLGALSLSKRQPVGSATGFQPVVPRYAVVRGQGGEGKTALAAEFARWMVRSQQMRRAAFVSVETHSHVAAVLDVLGRQLVGQDYSAAAFDDLEKATLPIERALREQPTLLVVDNMESILALPFQSSPGLQPVTPSAAGQTSAPISPGRGSERAEALDYVLSEDMRRELDAILQLCARLNAIGETRLIFTSREALPAPFDAARHRRELHRLDREDAVKLVERALNAAGGDGCGTSDAAREEIEALVEAVHGHARTLALLAPELRSRGVEATRAALVELMTAMEQQFPGSREHSLFASVELSLRRLSPANRDRARVLGVFHGGFQVDVLAMMMQWETVDVGALAGELIATGLATPNRYNHLTLNPALCPYLHGQMDTAEHETLQSRWNTEMLWYVGFLERQRHQNAELAATLTRLDLPNIFSLLEHVQRMGEAEATINLAGSLFTLLQMLGRPHLVDRVGTVRDAAAEVLGETWNHAAFKAQKDCIEQQFTDGSLQECLEGALQLMRHAAGHGPDAYPGADYDLATTSWLLARVLSATKNVDQAFPFLDQAQELFTAIDQCRPSKAAKNMVSGCLSLRAGCLLDLGRLEEAAENYAQSIRLDEQAGDLRGMAVNKAALGSVWLRQGRYDEARAAFSTARNYFTEMGEPGSVAAMWHQIGVAYHDANKPESAEDAYRKALAVMVELGNVARQAATLGQLGNLYADLLDRPEDACSFLHSAVLKHQEVGDLAGEARQRHNLADTLLKLRRFDEAREEIERAIQLGKSFGHASSPWASWSILANIGSSQGNAGAAAEAKRQATACYLAYRRDGAQNLSPDGRFSQKVIEYLLAGEPATVPSLLQAMTAVPNVVVSFRVFIQALQAIVAGRRDRTLADAPELDYTMAAEILFLLETLEKAGK